jgi:hypothetical protein
MIGQTTGIEKSVTAGAAITGFTIGKFGSDDNTMVPGAAAADLLSGVFQHDAENGKEVRVMLSGITRVKLGGSVTRGAKLTSDASALAIAAAPSAGANAQVIGIAMASGVSGDIIPMLIALSVMQG